MLSFGSKRLLRSRGGLADSQEPVSPALLALYDRLDAAGAPPTRRGTNAEGRPTLGEIARGTGQSVTHVSRIVSGKRRPSATALAKMASFLGIEMGALHAALPHMVMREQD